MAGHPWLFIPISRVSPTEACLGVLQIFGGPPLLSGGCRGHTQAEAVATAAWEPEAEGLTLPWAFLPPTHRGPRCGASLTRARGREAGCLEPRSPYRHSHLLLCLRGCPESCRRVLGSASRMLTPGFHPPRVHPAPPSVCPLRAGPEPCVPQHLSSRDAVQVMEHSLPSTFLLFLFRGFIKGKQFVSVEF